MKTCSNPNCLRAGSPQAMDNFGYDIHAKDHRKSRCKTCLSFAKKAATEKARATKSENRAARKQEAAERYIPPSELDKMWMSLNGWFARRPWNQRARAGVIERREV